MSPYHQKSFGMPHPFAMPQQQFTLPNDFANIPPGLVDPDKGVHPSSLFNQAVKDGLIQVNKLIPATQWKRWNVDLVSFDFQTDTV